MSQAYQEEACPICTYKDSLCFGMIINPSCVILVESWEEDRMKKVYQVEFRGQKEKYTFDSKQQAEDFATIQAVFGGKQYRIQAIIVAEEVAK